jgi:hypothetical protein
MPDRPLLLCYEGSDDAKHATSEAASAVTAPKRRDRARIARC